MAVKTGRQKQSDCPHLTQLGGEVKRFADVFKTAQSLRTADKKLALPHEAMYDESS